MRWWFCLRGETFIAGWSDVTKRLKILKPHLMTTNELQWETVFLHVTQIWLENILS